MGKQVLLIEDQPDIRRVIVKYLRTVGYELLEAADGQTGVRMALTEKPDLVLLNLSLPGMSGFDVARKLKENFKTSHIPIVACSGWQDENMVTQTVEAGLGTI